MIGLLGKNTPVTFESKFTGGVQGVTTRMFFSMYTIGVVPIELDFDADKVNNPVYTGVLYHYKTNSSISTKNIINYLATFTNVGSPSTIQKRLRSVIYIPENVSTFSLSTGLTTNATYYTNIGQFDFDYSKFTRLQNLQIIDTYNLVLTKPLPNIKILNLSGNLNMTSLPNLPQSLEHLQVATNNSISQYIVNNISELKNLNILRFGTWTYTSFKSFSVGNPTTFNNGSATLDISQNNNIKEIILSSFFATTFVLPNLSNINVLFLDGVATNNSTVVNGIDLTEIFSQLTDNAIFLRIYQYNLNNQTTPDGNLLPQNLEYLLLGRLRLNGAFNITTPHPNIKYIGLGSFDNVLRPQNTNRNIIPSVDLSGCTDLRGMNLSDLNLDDEDLILAPDLSLEQIFIAGNNFTSFDISNYPNLTHFYIGSYTQNSGYGQTGTHFEAIGLETRTNLQYYYAGETQLNIENYDLSQLTSLIAVTLDSTNISGELILPAVNTLTTIWAYNNPNLTKINSFPTTATNIILYNCSIPQENLPPLVFSSTMTNLRIGNGINMGQNGLIYPTIDLTNVPNCNYIWFNNMGVEAVIFPTGTRSLFDFRFHNNNLTTLTIPSNIIFADGNGASVFMVYSNQLDQTFPVGSLIRSRNIQLQDNNMSQVNVDETINNLWDGRLNFNNSGSKNFNIGGNNAAVTGTLQMPLGFTHDLTNTELNNLAIANEWTPKEKIWVLINCQVSSSVTTRRYLWTTIVHN